MHLHKVDPLRRLGAVVALALTVASCGSSDPVALGTSANRPPGAPTIDTALGTPADGAVDVSRSVTLNWKCTDADDDTLSYTVHFESTDPPAAVSTDQVGTSYGPVSMIGDATFYWQIVAKDPYGETMVSPVWSFTTVATGVETISTPGVPIGSVAGETGESLLFSATGSVSSENHVVEYQFSWNDDGGNSGFMDGTDAAHTWVTAGVYQVTARARCIAHPEVVSGWSAAFAVTLTEPTGETIGTPSAPGGPATGEINESLAYTTSAVTSSLGHPVTYTFNWGDGTDNTTGYLQVNHVWSVAGNYDVKVKAHCQTHPEIISAWSATTQVTISVPAEAISPPQIRSTVADVTGVGDEEWVSCYTTTSNLGHALEYRFDVENDGAFTAWSIDRNLYHTWLAAGTYTIRAQARCIEHPGIVSDWTIDIYAHEIVVNEGVETLSTPAMQPSGAVEYMVGENKGYSGYGASSSLGHGVRYQFDWGNGEVSDWVFSSTAYAYAAMGTFEVRAQARCLDHPDILSGWSVTTIVTIVEGITQSTLSGPSNGVAGTPTTFVAGGSTSSEGHGLEYRLLVGVSQGSIGAPQAWTTIDNLTHTFPYARGWYVRVQARCITDLAESIVSYAHYITISGR